MYMIWITIGVVIGCIVTNILYLARRSFGVLKIDRSNPEKDLYSFEIHENLDKLPKKKKILLKVKNITDQSQN